MARSQRDHILRDAMAETALFVVLMLAFSIILVFLVSLVMPEKAYAGSDSPTPYTVSVEGITLPDGVTFPDNGHVNIKADGVGYGLHLEGKCVERTDAECAGALHDAAQYIGKEFIPWTAFGSFDPCSVSWVQISMYDEH